MGCNHPKLVFGSGDFEIWCDVCGMQWIPRHEEQSNLTYEQSSLSGEVRYSDAYFDERDARE